MKRNISPEEISEGRLYGYHDMVKVDCHGCKRGWTNPCRSFLGEGKVELHVVDGCILPNLVMAGAEEACGFLDEEGRCSIHSFRPGVCRLFPLGRYYEDGDFRYFLQKGECIASNRSKVKVSKWIDMPEQEKYHDFLCTWHYLLKDVEKAVRRQEDGEYARTLNMSLLSIFYFEESAGSDDFYGAFEEKVKHITKIRAMHEI